MVDMLSFGVRYIVNDMEASIDFYTQYLAFEVIMHPNEFFAILKRSNLRLMINTPDGPGGGARTMPDGSKPASGGWNRIQIQVSDIEKEVNQLRKAGARFKNDIVTGIGAKQILLEDPSRNLIELFELLPQ